MSFDPIKRGASRVFGSFSQIRNKLRHFKEDFNRKWLRVNPKTSLGLEDFIMEDWPGNERLEENGVAREKNRNGMGTREQRKTKRWGNGMDGFEETDENREGNSAKEDLNEEEDWGNQKKCSGRVIFEKMIKKARSIDRSKKQTENTTNEGQNEELSVRNDTGKVHRPIASRQVSISREQTSSLIRGKEAIQSTLEIDVGSSRNPEVSKPQEFKLNSWQLLKQPPIFRATQPRIMKNEAHQPTKKNPIRFVMTSSSGDESPPIDEQVEKPFGYFPSTRNSKPSFSRVSSIKKLDSKETFSSGSMNLIQGFPDDFEKAQMTFKKLSGAKQNPRNTKEEVQQRHTEEEDQCERNESQIKRVWSIHQDKMQTSIRREGSNRSFKESAGTRSFEQQETLSNLSIRSRDNKRFQEQHKKYVKPSREELGKDNRNTEESQDESERDNNDEDSDFPSSKSTHSQNSIKIHNGKGEEGDTNRAFGNLNQSEIKEKSEENLSSEEKIVAAFEKEKTSDSKISTKVSSLNKNMKKEESCNERISQVESHNEMRKLSDSLVMRRRESSQIFEQKEENKGGVDLGTSQQNTGNSGNTFENGNQVFGLFSGISQEKTGLLNQNETKEQSHGAKPSLIFGGLSTIPEEKEDLKASEAPKNDVPLIQTASSNPFLGTLLNQASSFQNGGSLFNQGFSNLQQKPQPLENHEAKPSFGFGAPIASNKPDLFEGSKPAESFLSMAMSKSSTSALFLESNPKKDHTEQAQGQKSSSSNPFLCSLGTNSIFKPNNATAQPLSGLSGPSTALGSSTLNQQPQFGGFSTTTFGNVMGMTQEPKLPSFGVSGICNGNPNGMGQGSTGPSIFGGGGVPFLSNQSQTGLNPFQSGLGGLGSSNPFSTSPFETNRGGFDQSGLGNMSGKMPTHEGNSQTSPLFQAMRSDTSASAQSIFFSGISNNLNSGFGSSSLFGSSNTGIGSSGGKKWQSRPGPRIND